MKFRERFRAEYDRQMEKDCANTTAKLQKEAGKLGISHDLTIKVFGERRASTYMKIGWHPVSETFEKQRWGNFDVQVPVYTLTMEKW